MFKQGLQHLEELPLRTRILALVAVAAGLILTAILMTGNGAQDLIAPDTVAGNESSEQQAGSFLPDTPEGSQSEGLVEANEGGQTVQPPSSSNSTAQIPLATPEDLAIQREMNASLPLKPRRITPQEIAQKAPLEVKKEGAVLKRWSVALQECLGTNGAPRSCLTTADLAAKDVSYQSGTLVGDLNTDVKYSIYRVTDSGIKVWLMFSKGVECHGYADQWDKCSAW